MHATLLRNEVTMCLNFPATYQMFLSGPWTPLGDMGRKEKREKAARAVKWEGEERWRKEVKDCRKDEKSTISSQTLRHRCRCQIKASSIHDNFLSTIDYSERKWSTRKNPASCCKKVICKKIHTTSKLNFLTRRWQINQFMPHQQCSESELHLDVIEMKMLSWFLQEVLFCDLWYVVNRCIP